MFLEFRRNKAQEQDKENSENKKDLPEKEPAQKDSVTEIAKAQQPGLKMPEAKAQQPGPQKRRRSSPGQRCQKRRRSSPDRSRRCRKPSSVLTRTLKPD